MDIHETIASHMTELGLQISVFGQAKMDKMIVGIPYFDRWTKKASFLH